MSASDRAIVDAIKAEFTERAAALRNLPDPAAERAEAEAVDLATSFMDRDR